MKTLKYTLPVILTLLFSFQITYWWTETTTAVKKAWTTGGSTQSTASYTSYYGGDWYNCIEEIPKAKLKRKDAPVNLAPKVKALVEEYQKRTGNNYLEEFQGVKCIKKENLKKVSDYFIENQTREDIYFEYSTDLSSLKDKYKSFFQERNTKAHDLKYDDGMFWATGYGEKFQEIVSTPHFPDQEWKCYFNPDASYVSANSKCCKDFPPEDEKYKTECKKTVQFTNMAQTDFMIATCDFSPTGCKQMGELKQDNVEGFLVQLFGQMMMVLSLLVTLAVVIGGIMMASSAWNSERLSRGRNMIIFSLTALLLGLFSYWLVALVEWFVHIGG